MQRKCVHYTASPFTPFLLASHVACTRKLTEQKGEGGVSRAHLELAVLLGEAKHLLLLGLQNAPQLLTARLRLLKPREQRLGLRLLPRLWWRLGQR